MLVCGASAIRLTLWAGSRSSVSTSQSTACAGSGGRCAGAQGLELLRPIDGRGRAVRAVQRHRGDVDAGCEHDRRGFRVDQDVVLGRRRHVAALEVAAAHEHDALQPRRDLGRTAQGQRDVGLWREGDQADAVDGLAQQRLDQPVDRVRGLGWALRRCPVPAVDAGLAVDLGHRARRAQQRALRAGIDRHVATARELQDAARVVGRLCHRHIARDRRDAQQLELGRAEGHQQGQRVVLAGIGVDDQAVHHSL